MNLRCPALSPRPHASTPSPTQALLGCGKTLQDRITRHEFLAFCRRSKEIRNWIFTYDDSVTDADRSDAGGLAGGAVGSIEGFSGMPQDDARVLQIREEGMLIERTVAEVAAMEPDFFITSDLYTTVATNAAQAENVAFKGGDQFKASMEVRERQWVQLLESVAPNMDIKKKDGCVHVHHHHHLRTCLTLFCLAVAAHQSTR